MTTDRDDAQRDDGQPHLTIVTLGHGDHGKTTVTAAIASVLTPRAVGPNRRGAPEQIARVERITDTRHYVHVDMPDRGGYATNRIAGVARPAGAILVVSARDGVMPDAREHVVRARLVDVPRIVVALNKVDVVDDPALLDLVEREVRDLLSRYGFPGDRVPVVRVSALRALAGDPVWTESIVALLTAIDDDVPVPPSRSDRPFLMPIEHVTTVPGRGTVVSGMIEQGVITVGAAVEVVGLGPTMATVCTRLDAFGESPASAEAGDDVSLVLHDVDRDSVRRGQVVCVPGTVTPRRRFRARIYVLPHAEGGRRKPFFADYRPRFRFRWTEVPGVMELRADAMVLPGDSLELAVLLDEPIAISAGAGFTLRQDRQTVGVGTVIELPEARVLPDPPAGHRSGRLGRRPTAGYSADGASPSA